MSTPVRQVGDTRRHYRFGDYILDLENGFLRRGGSEVALRPKAFEVLGYLVERHGRVVSKAELMDAVWPGVSITENSLAQCLVEIRRALADESQEIVRTVARRGYVFSAAVSTLVAEFPRASFDLVEQDSRPPSAPQPQARKAWPRIVGGSAVLLLVLAAAAAMIPGMLSHREKASIAYTQITNFADSAVAPALSPDGRMVAFIRGGSSFLTPDQIYIQMLPDGEARRLTDDPRLKYGPAFSPDGSQVAYTVMEHSGWSTYAVSVLGGEPHLLLNNAAGLTWLDPHQLLFSQIKTGQHMGIVTGTETPGNFRELYFPRHERGMAHYSYASPDRTSALVVEMNEKPVWVRCQLLSLNGQFGTKPVGPPGSCTAAGWSPDGRWMYFAAEVDGQHHLWRQRFPDGPPEQITSGPTEEQGIAVDRDGRTVITSIGTHESTLWIHEPSSDRPLSSEGEVVGSDGSISIPSFGGDDQFLYYLWRRESAEASQELRRLTVQTGKSEEVFPGISMLEYDVSPDGRQVVYTTAMPDGNSQLWIAPMDRSSSPKRIGITGETSPYFGRKGEILFRLTEGNFNYLARMNPDGTGRSKVVPYPISTIQSVSPGRRWVTAVAPLLDRSTVAIMAIPVDGGDPVRICEIFCNTAWSTNGKFLFVSVEEPSISSPGRTLAIPVGPNEELPEFPPLGIGPLADASVIPGARSVTGAQFVPGKDTDTFVYVKSNVHRNLFRISLP